MFWDFTSQQLFSRSPQHLDSGIQISDMTGTRGIGGTWHPSLGFGQLSQQGVLERIMGGAAFVLIMNLKSLTWTIIIAVDIKVLTIIIAVDIKERFMK